ncbi:hypothetical protein Ddc_19469 [Ditylenchus destructor]|nr:hypothetical protein Ddc_19469 [Ditylenchus destructor]
MRGPEAHPATNLETLSDFLAEAMAVAVYEYRERNRSPTQFPQAVRLAAEAKGPFQCSPDEGCTAEWTAHMGHSGHQTRPCWVESRSLNHSAIHVATCAKPNLSRPILNANYIAIRE